MKILTITTLSITALVLMVLSGCEREKIVENTEIVRDIEYVKLPPDTIRMIDTVTIGDSVMIIETDTVWQFDTVVVTNDVHDTVMIHDTTIVYDTVTTIQHHYDTTVMVDTVLVSQCEPNEYLAMSALEYYSNPQVFDYIYQEFGFEGGWAFYLSDFQVDLTIQSDDVYDIYGMIDYWTPDWSSYCPFEYFWRMTYLGGDPADPRNWQMTEPPTPVAGHQPGIRVNRESTAVESMSR